MTAFAKESAVPVERTKGEIEKLVTRHGATKFVSGWEDERAVLLFEMRGRRVRFSLPLLNLKNRLITHDRRNWVRSAESAKKALDQDTRSRWRALLLVIKAKLEEADSGVETFEQAFLAHIVIPGGETIGERTLPYLDAACESGRLPPLLGVGS